MRLAYGLATMKHLSALILSTLMVQACTSDGSEAPPEETPCTATCCGGTNLRCLPNPMEDIEYFVIGSFYGECEGASCVDYYKINGQGVWEDTLDQYPGGDAAPDTSFDVALTNPGYYDSVAYSIKAFSEAYASGSVVGQPDAGDWGGYYLAIQFLDGTFWYAELDTQPGNVPQEWHNFQDSLDSAIEDLDAAAGDEY